MCVASARGGLVVGTGVPRTARCYYCRVCVLQRLRGFRGASWRMAGRWRAEEEARGWFPYLSGCV